MCKLKTIQNDGLKSRFAAMACFVLLSFMTGCGGNSMSSSNNPLITLITDYGTRDSYVAQMKGSILSINPRARIMDLNHEIAIFNLAEASYVVDQSARYFPPGTIFVVVVDPGVGSERRSMLLKTAQDHYFIGPDNGIFTLVMEREGVAEVHELTKPEYFRPGPVSETFHGRDIFGPVAAHVAAGEALSDFGPPMKQLTRLKYITAGRMGTKVTGQIMHVDHYGNIITNVPKKIFESDPLGKLVKVTIDGRTLSVPVVKTYSSGPSDRIFAVFNSEDVFELAYNGKPASDSLKAKPGTALSIVY